MVVNSRYTKGDLCGFTVQDEVQYGVVDATATSVHAGVMFNLSTRDDAETDEVMTCGSRRRGETFVVGWDYGFDVTYKVGRDVDWTKVFEYCTGSLAGIDKTQPHTFDALLKVADGSYDLFRGCAVNSLSIQSEEVATPLVFRADVFCATHDIQGPNPSVTPRPISTSTPLRCTDFWRCTNTDQSGNPVLGVLRSGRWTLTVTQNLQKCAGASEDGLRLASGQAPYLGAPEITLEVTVPAKDRVIDALRARYTTGLDLSVTIGNRVVTLVDCDLGTSMPDRTQEAYDDTVRLTARDVVVS